MPSIRNFDVHDDILAEVKDNINILFEEKREVFEKYGRKNNHYTNSQSLSEKTEVLNTEIFEKKGANSKFN